MVTFPAKPYSLQGWKNPFFVFPSFGYVKEKIR